MATQNFYHVVEIVASLLSARLGPLRSTRAETLGTTDVDGVGTEETWIELLDVSEPLVTFRWTCVFASDGEVFTSDSTLRFRERDEVEAALAEHGYVVDEVRDAPDRPGRELVFVASRP